MSGPEAPPGRRLKQQERAGLRSSNHKLLVGLRSKAADRAQRTPGFTLIEVLVVLAILVILFGLLFVPLISGLDMASRGRSAARLQQDTRIALERLRRDLADAIYVYPTYRMPTPGSPAPFVSDTSRRLFVLPARDPAGVLYQPLRFDLFPPGAPLAGNIRVVRYMPERPNPSAPYSEDNPFVLYRSVGTYDPVSGVYLEDAREALTGTERYDVPVVTSVCVNPADPAPAVQAGFMDVCPNCGLSLIRYLHKGFTVRSQRIAGELLRTNDVATVYRAGQGGWDGFAAENPDGTLRELLVVDPIGGTPDIDPRIMAYQYVPPTIPPSGPIPDPRRDGAWSLVVYDSFQIVTPIDPALDLTYDRRAGTVLLGTRDSVTLTAETGSAATANGGSLASLNGTSPEYAYLLTPAPSTSILSPSSKIVVETVRVWAMEDTNGNGTVGDPGDQYVEYTRTNQSAQDDIGFREFWVGWNPDLPTAAAEIRFNSRRFDASLNTSRAFGGIHVECTYRRNLVRFTWPPTGEVIEIDDVVRADYSTRWAYQVNLSVAEVISKQGAPAAWPNMILNEAPMSVEVNVANMGR